MIGQTISHYRVLAKLGGGGMGVVYEEVPVREGPLSRHEPRRATIMRLGELSLIALLLATACARGPVGDDWVVTRNRALSAALDELNAPFRGPHMPGAIVAVLQGGDVIHLKGYGFANREFEVPWDPTIRYTYFSMTKSMTACAMLRLEEQGRLSLEDEIQQHLPDFPRLEHPITIRHLLTHTSGLHEDETLIHLVGTGAAYGPITLDELYELGKKQARLAYRPGSFFYYNDTGMRYAARIIETVTVQSFGAAMQDLVFGPAGMTTASVKSYEPRYYPRQAASYDLGGDPKLDPARDAVTVLGIIVETSGDGAVTGSMNDLIHYVRFLGARSAQGRSWLERLAEPVYYREGVLGPYRTSIGVGNHRGLEVIGHRGLYGKIFAFVPELDLWVLAMENALGRGPGTTEQVATAIDAVLASDSRYAKWLAPDNPEREAVLNGRPRRQDFSNAETEALVGTHFEPQSGYVLRIRAQEDRLLFSLLGEEADLVRDGQASGAYRTDPVQSPVIQIATLGKGALGLVVADWPAPRPLQRLDPASRKPPADLTTYEGLYRSTEFGVIYDVAPHQEGTLSVCIGAGARRSDRLVLTHVTGDVFEGLQEAEGTFLNVALLVRFTRRGGQVDGLEASANDVRGLVFDRLEVTGG